MKFKKPLKPKTKATWAVLYIFKDSPLIFTDRTFSKKSDAEEYCKNKNQAEKLYQKFWIEKT